MKAYRIHRPDTAFRLSGGKKRPREHANAHLKWIRTLPSVISGKHGCEAAHIRFGDERYGKRETGGQEKPSDKWTLPLRPEEHRDQHDNNEREWWRAQGIDPLDLASKLWTVTGDDEAGELIIRNAIQSRPLKEGQTG